ncbi:tetratricopeptide repeat protein [Anaeromicropila populeti]|uniref:Tetratricopeptide repeat-containing protein n=1 Tax=Anaeromicropila populeti TaxID=37658 RepID=A0A1I6I5B4_9FIRM|nr:hypothetical protein [Anaeromicropila populeti]SFR61937.1 hypothetical protein SAMN05661086_00428 [Anaeromicropila populeti]
MSKYDNEIKCAEVRKLLSEEKYMGAYEILQTINITRVKSLTDYKAFYEIYCAMKLYDEAKKMLLLIYERNSSSRILYQLVCLEMKAGRLDEAELCFKDYVEKAPEAGEQYILRYLIDKAKHLDYKTRIDSLEKLKKVDYYEEWGYELAKLYHKAGMAEKCIEECNDLITWFGEGIIVEKAKMLKKYYVSGKESFLEDLNDPNQHRSHPESDTLFYNTSDIGAQVIKIASYQKQLDLKNELEQELTPTINIQESMVKDMLKARKKQESPKPEIVEETELPAEFIGSCNLNEVFGKFMKRSEVRQQLIPILYTIIENKAGAHFLIIGENDLEKMDFIKKLSKALQILGVITKTQVAKIKGENLNRIQLEQRVEKLRNSILLVEGASQLYVPTVQSIVDLMERLEDELVVVLEDTEENMQIFLEEHFDFKEHFAYTIRM